MTPVVPGPACTPRGTCGQEVHRIWFGGKNWSDILGELFSEEGLFWGILVWKKCDLRECVLEEVLSKFLSEVGLIIFRFWIGTLNCILPPTSV